ncbi:hypothetical protein [Curtobacterium luteum]|uniref:hypothetical protein n=1 Tax=Curtobacterium luteum TaxID=33881 RepID=UPI00128F8261|nr:hypothetical protein [Curtobacterium luteum]
MHDAPPEILEFSPVQLSRWRIIFGGLGPTALCSVIGGIVVLFPGARETAFVWAAFAALYTVMVWPSIVLVMWHRRVATIRITDDSVEFRGIVRRRLLPRDEDLRCLRSAFDNWPANEILFIVHGGRRRRRIRIDSWNWTTPRIREISGVLRARTRLPSKGKKIEQLVPGATRYWERSIVKLFALIFAGCLLAIIAVVIVFGVIFPMG